MEKAKCLFFFYAFLASLSILGIEGVKACGIKYKGSTRRMFVFGDSYVDTGNFGKIGRDRARSWYEPYGMTFPHRPTGRFSDGRVLTDYIASFLEIPSPIPYKYRRSRSGSKIIRYGMNFAVGGSGVFDTGNSQRSLSAQVGLLESLIKEGVFSKTDIRSSVALVAVSGNDYSHFLDTGGEQLEIFDFIENNVTVELKSELKRIHELGFEKVVAAGLTPLDCTPYITRENNHTHCSFMAHLMVTAHNDHLLGKMEELRNETRSSSYLFLDLQTPFMSVIDREKRAKEFKHTLKPCCESKESESYCGKIDDKGVKQYSLCSNPRDYFYFDAVHPTDAGWAAVVELIKPWLNRHL